MFLENFLKNKTVSIMVTTIPIASEMGAAYNIPSIPSPIGKQITSGIKQIISLIKETIVALIFCPTAWKKIEVILIKQVPVTKDKNILNSFLENSRYNSSFAEPNIPIIASGNISMIPVETIPTIKENIKISWYVFFTLTILPAP